MNVYPFSEIFEFGITLVAAITHKNILLDILEGKEIVACSTTETEK